MSTMELQLPNSFVDVERDVMEYVDGGTTYSGAQGWGAASALAAIGTGASVGVSGVIAMLMPFGPVGWLGAATIFPADYILGQLGSAGRQALWDMAVRGSFTITTNNNPFSMFSVS